MSATTVRHLDTVCISVTRDGEHGRFYLRSGVHDDGNHWCELTCNTTFGVVGHYWGNMGSPAKNFLSKLSKDYLLGKLWGLNTEVWDDDRAFEVLRDFVLSHRREQDLDQHDARAAYDALDDEGMSHGAVEQWLIENPECYDLGAWELDLKVENPQCTGFWNTLWAPFVTALQQDLPVYRYDPSKGPEAAYLLPVDLSGPPGPRAYNPPPEVA